MLQIDPLPNSKFFTTSVSRFSVTFKLDQTLPVDFSILVPPNSSLDIYDCSVFSKSHGDGDLLTLTWLFSSLCDLSLVLTPLLSIVFRGSIDLKTVFILPLAWVPVLLGDFSLLSNSWSNMLSVNWWSFYMFMLGVKLLWVFYDCIWLADYC